MARKSDRVPGSVYRHGERWRAQLPPSLGRRAKTVGSREEAQQWLREENAKAALGIPAGTPDIQVRVAGLETTVAKLAHGQLNEIVELRADVRELTAVLREILIRLR